MGSKQNIPKKWKVHLIALGGAHQRRTVEVRAADGQEAQMLAVEEARLSKDWDLPGGVEVEAVHCEGWEEQQ